MTLLDGNLYKKGCMAEQSYDTKMLLRKRLINQSVKLITG